MDASFQTLPELKNLCRKLIQNPKDVESIKKLKILLEASPLSFIKVIQPTILSTFYPVIKSISENKTSFSINEKQLIIDTFQVLFEKSSIDKLGLFFNIYAFLLFEIYDHIKHQVLSVDEEYKLSIIQCTKSLAKSVSSELTVELYTKINAPKLCQMVYVSIEIAKNERLKSLRIASIECIMHIAKIFDLEDFKDIVIRKQVSEVFLFFLPGVASGLKQIALEDEKVGHKIPMTALKAWGRIVTLLMQDYNSAVISPNIVDIKTHLPSTEKSKSIRKKFNNNKEVNEYLQNSKISSQWYFDTDKKLQHLVVEFMKLTHHSHQKVRLELAELCAVILENCLGTMPVSARYLIEIVITLTEDEDLYVSNRSNEILSNLSNSLSSDNLKSLLESLAEGFLNGVNSLPRKFNGIDEREQLASLNLLIGYLNLFGQHRLYQILLSANHLNNLLNTIIHISELEKSDIGLLEEYSIKDLNPVNLETPWKRFTHFKEDSIRKKLEKLCSLLGKFDTFRMVCDFLLDIILFNAAQRKEAIFILNAVITDIEPNKENIDVIKNIIDTYIDSQYWQIPVVVSVDEDGYEYTLSEVQHNAVQVCLLVEGIGKVALVLKEQYRQFILKILYIVLEKAGSSHSLVRSAGLLALNNITVSCGYVDITQLITNNIDYFTYHVERKLNKSENKESVLGVLSVVLRYSTIDVLQYISYTIQEALVQSCDKFKATNINAFLEVFKIFLKALKHWLKIEIYEEPFKTRAEKLKEYEEFKISGTETIINNDFSDDVMDKTAEEMYEEDRKKKEEELTKEIEEPEVPEYKKPESPLHVKLVVAVLNRCLHFLPSKDKLRKLLVLEILSDGLEIIKDSEDELLPIVHQIWSPLVQRFKEFDEHVIINYSFQLLTTLARLTKEFIRMRTVKEVLPSILELMKSLSTNSRLKDKGSAYRYSQAYKLQLTILNNIARLLINLDVDDTQMEVAANCLGLYLSDKQPIPLQTAAIESLKLLAQFDPEVVYKLMPWNNNKDKEFEKNLKEVDDYFSTLNLNK